MRNKSQQDPAICGERHWPPGSDRSFREYRAYLEDLRVRGVATEGAAISFWSERIRELSAGGPMQIGLSDTASIRSFVRDVIGYAALREAFLCGPAYLRPVLGHLVGAKLDCVLGSGTIIHGSFRSSRSPTGRAGDFFIGDVALHITTSPGEAVIERCRENLNDGYRPILVTLQHGSTVADGLASNAGLADRIDIFEIEQFVALNLYEWGKFGADGRKTAVAELVDRYNQIVEEFETDPSLKIELRR